MVECMSALVPCPFCGRHVRASEPACPFCARSLPHLAARSLGSEMPRLSRAGMLAFAASVTTMGCHEARVQTGDAATAQVAPTVVPSAPASRDAGVADASRQRPDDLGSVAAAYGGPPAGPSGPSGRVELGETTASVPLPNAPSVVAGLRAGFRACYNAGLNQDPTLSGRVTIIAKVLPTGEVDTAAPAGNSGLSDPVVKCLIRKMRNAQFDPPGPEGSTVQVPLTLTPRP